MPTHRIIDYIDRIIPTNGFIDNNFDSDMQFWTGYRIFVRNDLDDYDSVEDWKKDQGGFKPRGRYEGYGAVTEYVLQTFLRGSSSIADAGLKSYNMGLMSGWVLESSTSHEAEKEHMFMLIECDHEWPMAVVNLHRRRHNLPEIVQDEELDIYQMQDELLDTTSETALLEQERVKINEREAS